VPKNFKHKGGFVRLFSLEDEMEKTTLIDDFGRALLNTSRCERSNSARAKAFRILHSTLSKHKNLPDCRAGLDAIRDVSPFSHERDFRRAVSFAIRCLPRTAEVERTLAMEIRNVACERVLARATELLDASNQNDQLKAALLDVARAVKNSSDRRRRLDEATRRR
jgi:hypothetical protein